MENDQSSDSIDLERDTFRYTPGQSIGYLLRDTYRYFSKSLEQKIAPYGVTLGQWYFLRELWEEDGLSQRELAKRTSRMESTTVVAINGLVKSGFAKRARDKKDKRKYRIRLTKKGHGLKSELLPFAKAVNEEAASNLSAEEIALFRDIISRMKKGLNATEELPDRRADKRK